MKVVRTLFLAGIFLAWAGHSSNSMLLASEGSKAIGKTPDLARANWIWAPKARTGAGAASFFRCKINLEAEPVEATVALTADNGYELFVNGQKVAGELGYGAKQWSSVERFRIEKHLNQGQNVISIKGECLGGAAGVVSAVYVKTADGKDESIVTDQNWLSIAKAKENWTEPDHDDTLWKPAKVIGRMGCRPWGRLSIPAKLTDPKTLVIDRTIPGRYVPPPARFTEPDSEYEWPAGVVYIEGKAPVHSTRAATTKFSIRGTQSWFEYDTPAPAVSGRRLYALTPARPDASPELLLDAGNGLIATPVSSYDGREIVFSMVPEGEKFYKLFRIGAGGSDLKRLTTGPWQDYDPEFLPDGRIVFASTRIGSREEYHANTAHSLFTLSADRREIRPLTYHIVADSEPAVMPDGRIAFVRQDNFMERAKVETRIHAIRADGTGGQTLIGPDRGTIRYDRATGAEYPHQWLRNYGFGSPAPMPGGRIACLSNFGPLITDVSLRERRKLERLSSDVPLFDISSLPGGRLLCSTPGGELGILDPNSGKVVKLFESSEQLHSAVFLGARVKPRLMPNMVKPEAERSPDKTGYLLCQNVFKTQQVEGDWQRVKAVRIIQGKPFTLRAARHQYGHIGVEGIELGTAPVAPDGSFYVRVPADRSLAIQCVDAEGRPVVNEMSWIYVRPGETRSCTGCHSRRQAAPGLGGSAPLASFAPPVDLTGGGRPHRFRANNAANGGALNLQFDRFREVASIDSYNQPALEHLDNATGLAPGRSSAVEKLATKLRDGKPGEKVSAARRLAMFRDRAAAGSLAAALEDPDDSVRLAAALALAACGNREVVPSLLRALKDGSVHVAQSAHIALEHLTGHTEKFDPYRIPPLQTEPAGAWQEWIEANDWDAIEGGLIEKVCSENPTVAHHAIEALGHVGSERSSEALRGYVESGPRGSLVARLAAIRALGHLRDEAAIPLLAGILEKNTVKTRVRPPRSHEFGWAAVPDHLAGAAAEALGRIGTPEAETRLIGAFGKLVEFWYYTFRTADHSWLMGCHSSIAHFRIIEALDAIGSAKAGDLTGKLLESIPIDTDRGLIYENDAYEIVTARLIHRSGMSPAVLETCLAVLGEANAKGVPDLKKAVTKSPPAVSVRPLSPESRAAQLLSVVCLRPEDAARVRAALTRYRSQSPSRKRSWVCFFLARALGKLRDEASVAELRAALDDDPTEFSFGVPNPPNVFIHNAMTPAYRAAAADALGRIGAKASVPSLLAAVKDFDNAMEVRQAAASALVRLGDKSLLPQLRKLANEYPEVATRRTLFEGCLAK